MATNPKYPERIYAQVSPRSQGGISLFEVSGPINLSNIDSFRSAPDIVRQAKERFLNAGFEIIHPTRRLASA